jgi:hypothetical protein
MKEKTAKDPEKEIIRLEEIIKAQAELIFQYRENYLINMFNSLQAITGEFSILLNPEPLKIKATCKNQSELFLIQTSNIICIVADGREKKILLKSPINTYGGEETRTTSIISTSNNWKLLKKEVDRIGFHLFPINKTVYVNVKYFSFENNCAITKAKLPVGFEKYNSVKITKNHVDHFRERKENYLRVFRLQKQLVDYKVKNGYLV